MAAERERSEPFKEITAISFIHLFQRFQIDKSRQKSHTPHYLMILTPSGAVQVRAISPRLSSVQLTSTLPFGSS